MRENHFSVIPLRELRLTGFRVGRLPRNPILHITSLIEDTPPWSVAIDYVEF